MNVASSPESFVRQARPSGVGPVALIVLDGFGLSADTTGNAVAQARKPVYDKLWANYPHTTLIASGEAVGLPNGQFGNSEVGHSNIGAGRVLYQDLTRINKAISTGSFYENKVLRSAIDHVLRRNSALHLVGLLSDGGVHSHIDHLLALLRMAAAMNAPRVYLHMFMDGRDTAPNAGLGYLARVIDAVEALGTGQIASVHGRYYAMDRDTRWERTEQTYRAMVYGDGEVATNPRQVVADSYARGVTDEFVQPMTIVDECGKPVGLIQDNDAIMMFNYRPDRAIQLSQAFTNAEFDGFARGSNPPHVKFVCMTKYSDSVGGAVAYEPANLDNTLGEVLAQRGMTQLRAAETEKYPHVTFFFSGGREPAFPGETRVLIPSPKVATYDLQPEMSAYPLAAAVAEKIQSGDIDVVILNFANPDMVGHTGDLKAAIAAVEAVDSCLGTVLDALHHVGGIALVTADHGNADVMIDGRTGGPCTTHTTNPVPLIVTMRGVTLRTDGILADLAPTMLHVLGISQPVEMTGLSLIETSRSL